MMQLLKSIEEQKAGRDLLMGVLLTVCLGGIAFMVSIYPESTEKSQQINIYWLSCTLLGITFFTCIISLFRKMAEADLMVDITQIPNINETLEKMRSNPKVRIQQTKRGDMLAFRMRVITWAFRVTLLTFFLWLGSLAIYAYVSNT